MGEELGFFASQPPSLVGALANAIGAGDFGEGRLVYMHATEETGSALLKLGYYEVLKPRPFYMGPAEQALVAAGGKDGRKVVHFIPIAFSDTPRAIRAEPQIDIFPLQVSATDQAGYFSLV